MTIAIALAQSSFALADPPPKSTFVVSPSNTAKAPGLMIPHIEDPMLTPVPPATRILSSWREAFQLIRSRSTDLRIALDQARQAEAQTEIALAGALPTLNGTVTGTHQFITKESVTSVAGVTTTKTLVSPTPNSATGLLTLAAPIVNLGAWNGVRTAKANETAARLSLDDMHRTIALSVAKAMVASVTAGRIAELNRVGLLNSLQRLDLTERKKLYGVANGLDVLRAKQDVAATRATLVNGDESLRRARESLGLGLGLPEGVGVPHTVDMSGLEKEVGTLCKPIASLQERTDLKSSLSALEAARRNLATTWLNFLPTITAQSQLATSTFALPSAPPTTWNVQGILSVPFFDGGSRYGSMHNARAQVDIAEQNLEALRRQATVQVTQARRSIEVADRSREIASTARELAIENDRLIRIGYQEGQNTSLELVLAATALREAEINFALREFDTVSARIAALLTLSTCTY